MDGYRKFLFGVAMLLACLGCGQESSTTTSPSTQAPVGSVFQLHGDTMGVRWNVTTIGLNGDLAKLTVALQDAVGQVDEHMSTYKPDSEISRFGMAPANQDFAVSADTAFVVQEAQRISALTKGAFDATVMPLVDLWGFGPAETSPTAPTKEQIAEALSRCGYSNLAFTEEDPRVMVKTTAGLRLDLSAIAKGYGVDAMCAVLDAANHENYLVEVGGELRVKGVSIDGTPWRIGIDTPRDMTLPGTQLQGAIEVGGIAIATSGDYRNYRELNGKRISHIIDPRTGYPVNHGLASVSILAPTCLEADALATACMVLGPEQAMALIERLDGIEIFLIVREGEEFLERKSAGFPEIETL
ncbi:MAG: FAD:protein FMN transferase [Planctomycetota bacterium]|nr:FAD:protein FMN transferase [Planctomycetota bacterium]